MLTVEETVSGIRYIILYDSDGQLSSTAVYHDRIHTITWSSITV